MSSRHIALMHETQAADAVRTQALRPDGHSVREFMVPSSEGTILAGEPMPALVRRLWNVKIKRGENGLYLDRHHGIVQDHFVQGGQMEFPGEAKLWLSVTTHYATATDQSDGEPYRTGGKLLSVTTSFTFHPRSSSGPTQTDTQPMKTEAFIICDIRKATTEQEQKAAVDGYLCTPVLERAIFYTPVGF